MNLDLNNDHNVYILGAGFSRDAGLPLISDFLVRMRDSHPWLVEQRRLLEAESVAEVLRFRLNAASAAYWTNLDLENVEELFSLAASSDEGLTSHVQRAIAATLDYSRSVSVPHEISLRMEGLQWTRATQWLDRGRAEGYFTCEYYAYVVAKLLGMFRTGRVTGRNSFITFNYDTILEEACRKLSVDYDYGLDSGLEIDAGSRSRKPGDISTVRILKLHGSVNWARDDQQSEKIRVFPGYRQLEERRPEIVPPTWRKVFQDQVADVWKRAIQEIRDATRIVVLGFSIPPTDIHFKYLLAAGLQRNVSLRRMAFFNPAAEDIKARASDILRAQYIQSGLISFLPTTLRDLCAKDDYLAELGRPAWIKGDRGRVSEE